MGSTTLARADRDDGYETWFMYGAALYLRFVRDRYFGGDAAFIGLVVIGSNLVSNVPLVYGIEPPPELWQVDEERIFGLTIRVEELPKVEVARLLPGSTNRGKTVISAQPIVDCGDERPAVGR